MSKVSFDYSKAASFIADHEIEKEQDAFIHWNLNKEFHLTLTAMSGNSYYTKTLEKIMKQCFRGASQYYGESWENNLHREDMRWHRKLIDALKNENIP